MFLTIVVFGFISASLAQQCIPGDNCKLPDCRCADDTAIPGGLSPDETPQMVVVTFEDVLNEANAQLYTSLFRQDNPNGCPPRGTFFIQDTFTNYEIAKSLYDEGHEFGARSLTGSIPNGTEGWRTELKIIKDKLVGAGLDPDDVLGVRAPNLEEGGLDEFIGLGDNKYLYDASCVTSEFDEQANLKWPYTYDFVPGPKCDIGNPPNVRFPGKWQFLLPDIHFNGSVCATPSACTNVKTQRDAFDLFFNSFVLRRQGKRSPHMIVVNPNFVTVNFKRKGLIQFLEFIRAAFEDTWVVTAHQALQWIQDPTPLANITDFQPWQC